MQNKTFSIKDNLPKQFLENMKSCLTNGDLELLIDSYSKLPSQGIIVNKAKINEDSLNYLIRELNLKSLDKFTYEICDTDYLLKIEKIGKGVFHHAGSFYVSEPSAMSVIPKLPIKEDDKILDLCASPGGKSIQALMYLDESKGGILYSNEIIPSRCKILSSNLERMGICNVVILNSDAKTLSKKFKNYFNKIIIDAPCSGEGMFRKYPYAISEWSMANVDMCARRQIEIVSDGLTMLKEGGYLAYSTCTFEKKEDEEIKDYILSNFNLSLEYEEKIFPYMGKGEGQYIAIFKKESGVVSCFNRVNTFKNKISNNYKDLYLDFEKTYLNKSLIDENKYLSSIGDNIFLSNKTDIDLYENFVYKNGVLLGSVSKNTFVPSHALSHVVSVENFKNKIDFSSNLDLLEKYLNGDEISVNMDTPVYNKDIMKGYCLICYNNLGLGLGKVNIKEDRIIIKNHYPKGLRNL